MAKGTLVSEAMVIGIFEQIKLNPDITNESLAAVWNRPENTIMKIRRTGSPEGWKAEKKRKAEEERKRAEERRRKAEEQPAEEPEEEQVPGQIAMDLTMATGPKPVEGIQVEIDQVKMMRFLAGQMDKVCERLDDQVVMVNMKLDQLNDTISMILRAVRRE